MNIRNQLLCAWASPVVLTLFLIGCWPLAHFIPAWPPNISPTDVATLYQTNTAGIRLGMVLMMLGGAFLIPFAGVIATQMKRIEGEFSALAFTQLGGGFGVFLFLTIPALFYTATAYRPERSSELMLLLNDLSWIFFIMPFGPAVIQNLAIGLAILSDQTPNPIFPRWVGYFNIWVALLFLPGGMITFFKSGPFAWNGLLAFYVPATLFGVWLIVMFFVVIKAIKEQESWCDQPPISDRTV